MKVDTLIYRRRSRPTTRWHFQPVPNFTGFLPAQIGTGAKEAVID
jgi:hypothetical protein